MKEMLEIIIRNLVEYPDAVEVTEIQRGRTTAFEVKVENSDMGKVIGKQGKIATSIRIVTKAIAAKENKKIVIEFVG